ncbi:MAG: M15 family metallopeptidase [Candidatus Kapaibacterium sp.]
MSRSHLPIAVSSCFLCLTIVWSQSSSVPRDDAAAVAQSFHTAYPSTVLSHTDSGITLVNGRMFTSRSHAPEDAYERMLDAATLADMLNIPYAKGVATGVPPRNHDPGRARHTAFFDAMYGGTSAAVKKACSGIRWVDGTSLQCTRINGVDHHLQSIADEFRRSHPRLLPYLTRPGGTLVWRTIAGTHRRSAHSYGIAIDINVERSDYWRTAGTRDTEVVYRNRIPQEIVDVFERHGFIWGGKWYHYDTMHFEFRPELCPPACSCQR